MNALNPVESALRIVVNYREDRNEHERGRKSLLTPGKPLTSLDIDLLAACLLNSPCLCHLV
jgi:hypothetical protein